MRRVLDEVRDERVKEKKMKVRRRRGGVKKDFSRS